MVESHANISQRAQTHRPCSSRATKDGVATPCRTRHGCDEPLIPWIPAKRTSPHRPCRGKTNGFRPTLVCTSHYVARVVAWEPSLAHRWNATRKFASVTGWIAVPSPHDVRGCACISSEDPGHAIAFGRVACQMHVFLMVRTAFPLSSPWLGPTRRSCDRFPPGIRSSSTPASLPSLDSSRVLF